MSQETITITREELFSGAVDSKISQRTAVEKAKASLRDASNKPSRVPVLQRSGIWHNAFVTMTLFGLIGGLVAGVCGELVLSLAPNSRVEAAAMLKIRDQLLLRGTLGELSDPQTKSAVRELDYDGAANPYYRLEADSSLTEKERDQRLAQLTERDRLKGILVGICLYAVWGIFLATALGMTEILAVRSIPKAAAFAGAGAVLGLIGGTIITLCFGPPDSFLGGAAAIGGVLTFKQFAVHSLIWGLLGLLLSVAPGLMMRNLRKLGLSMIGGLVGGALGGLLFDPIVRATSNDIASRIVAITAIGMLTGFFIAIIENVAKRGWLKVVEGMIAGKQFIIYRNPTIIGSHPRCEIYLFKDDAVLRHHAVLHIVPTGYELEDLGSGRTLVNDRPIIRVRLRNGDRIRIGRTRFDFRETAHGRSPR